MDDSENSSINLNDDLTFDSESSRIHRSTLRSSIDELQNEEPDIYSPLGPNSIYELIIGSDMAKKKNRIVQNTISLFNGQEIVSNVNKPSMKDIPQIQLAKLKQKVSSQQLEDKYYTPIIKDYKQFEASQNVLTKDVLNQLDQESKSIDEIPEIFRSSEYRLDDPRIFKQVLKSLTTDEDLSNVLNNVDFLEKISNYLDIVEVNLAKEVESSSDSFFNAIDDINNVTEKSNRARKLYSDIVDQLDQLEQSSIKGKEIVDKSIELKNVEALESSIIQIQYVLLTFQSAKESPVDKCIDEILKCEKLLFDLPAFIHIENDLQNLKNECGIKFTDRFLEILINDLNREEDEQTTLDRLYHRKAPVYQENIKSELKNVICQLQKCGVLVQAYTTYQNRFLIEIKEIIKRNLPKTDLSSTLKMLTPKEFEQLIFKIYAQLSQCLRRLTVHQKLLLDLANDSDLMSLDITKGISKAIELTQIRLMKIISVRSEQTADLSMPYYLRLYSITSCYLHECETIDPSTGNILGEWFNNHITYFLHRFHSNSIKEMTNHVLKETWKICDDKQALGSGQLILDEIFNPSYTEYFNFVQTKESKTIEVEQITIDQESFLLPSLAISILPIIRNYIIISKVFSNDNLSIFLKDLNLKVSQSVLGAGATKTAGLKHITTKHLALCIRFIQFNISILEKLNLPEVTHFKDHENELFSKIINIMKDRTIIGCNKLVTIQFNHSPNSYMEDLIKDTLTVAKVLTRYLPSNVYTYILTRIFDNYKKIIIETCLTKLPLFKDFDQKYNLLKDIDYFRVKLSDVPGYGNSGQVIWENVNNLQTEEDIRMDEKMRKSIDEPAKESKPRLSFERLVNSVSRGSREPTKSPPRKEEVKNVRKEEDIVIVDESDQTPMPESREDEINENLSSDNLNNADEKNDELMDHAKGDKIPIQVEDSSEIQSEKNGSVHEKQIDNESQTGKASDQFDKSDSSQLDIQNLELKSDIDELSKKLTNSEVPSKENNNVQAAKEANSLIKETESSRENSEPSQKNIEETGNEVSVSKDDSGSLLENSKSKSIDRDSKNKFEQKHLNNEMKSKKNESSSEHLVDGKDEVVEAQKECNVNLENVKVNDDKIIISPQQDESKIAGDSNEKPDNLTEFLPESGKTNKSMHSSKSEEPLEIRKEENQIGKNAQQEEDSMNLQHSTDQQQDGNDQLPDANDQIPNANDQQQDTKDQLQDSKDQQEESKDHIQVSIDQLQDSKNLQEDSQDQQKMSKDEQEKSKDQQEDKNSTTAVNVVSIPNQPILSNGESNTLQSPKDNKTENNKDKKTSTQKSKKSKKKKKNKK